MKAPLCIAHRGASAFAPENTFAAMHKAKALGAGWVEFDVQLTQDKELVVFHDPTLERLTGNPALIAESTYAELKTYDIGSWFDPRYANERIPHLTDMLKLLATLTLHPNLEIKPVPGNELIMAKKMLECLQDWPLSPPLISSFSLEFLEILRTLNRTLPIGLLIHEWQDEWADRADSLDCTSINLHYLLASPQRIEEIKATQRPILCYTINDEKIAKKLLKQGITGIYSDSLMHF